MKIITSDDLKQVVSDTETCIDNIAKDKNKLSELNNELLSYWTGTDGQKFVQYVEQIISVFDLYVDELRVFNKIMGHVNDTFKAKDESLSTPII